MARSMFQNVSSASFWRRSSCTLYIARYFKSTHNTSWCYWHNFMDLLIVMPPTGGSGVLSFFPAKTRKVLPTVDFGDSIITYNHLFAVLCSSKSGSGIFPTFVRNAGPRDGGIYLALPRHEWAANLFWDIARKYVQWFVVNLLIRHQKYADSNLRTADTIVSRMGKVEVKVKGNEKNICTFSRSLRSNSAYVLQVTAAKLIY